MKGNLLASDTVTSTKLLIKTKSNLIEQVFETILQSGEAGIFQTELCKVFSLDSRDGSRLVSNLEKRDLISRERILYNGRWTYKVVVKKSIEVAEFVRKPIEIASVEGAPCFGCTYQHLCSSEDETSQYSPEKCRWIEEWVLLDLSHVTTLSQQTLKVSE
jgi:DNA-binding MarR family transcriptional regulator